MRGYNNLLHFKFSLIFFILCILKCNVIQPKGGAAVRLFCACILPSLWVPPAVGWIKANFNVAVKNFFAVAVAVLSDELGNIVAAASLKLVSTDVLQGEATTALLAVFFIVISFCWREMLFLWCWQSTILLYFFFLVFCSLYFGH